MTKNRQDRGTVTATLAVLTPFLMALIVHPSTLTVFAALTADILVTAFRWLWLLRRDLHRQRTAEALVRAANGQPTRIVLDPSGRIEIHRYGTADPGHKYYAAIADRADAPRS